MRTLLVLLAGCWSTTTPAPKPVPVVASPAYDELVRATPLDPFTGEIYSLSHAIEKPAAPWTSIVVGETRVDEEVHYVIELGVGGTRYGDWRTSSDDGWDVEILKLVDLVPGGAPELLVQDIAVNDGGQRYGLSACGIGPSGVPSCGSSTWSDPVELYQPSSFVLSTPREGGVLLTPKAGGPRKHIGFDFP